MTNKKRYLVTSALPYANGPLHIGHLAGAYVSADIYVRYLRLMGKDVVWVCGSDEHGAAITIRAMKEGLTPREIIDKYDAMFRKAFAGMGIAFDIFHRTSEPIHYDTSQDFFRQLHKNGEFEVIENEQYFDEEKQSFLADRYISGTCPKCANPDAYGDQCEKCGSDLSPNDLIEPIRSTLSGSKPVKKRTKHWYLKLNEYETWLKRWITEGVLEDEKNPALTVKTHNPNDWKNHVMGQCKSWLDGGLHPRAMTRDLDWGIPVPPEIDESGQKKLYVWLDAPIGYISATKQWAIDKGQPDLWKTYWQDDETALIHFIGKDNIVFHCLIFPALLREHGGYVLPVNVPANQFMNLEGRKISTSKNWAVWVHEYLEDFPGQEDVLRYNMIKNMPEQRDSEFTWKGFQEANNSELVNNLANFINRVVVLLNKYYSGKVPVYNNDVDISTGKLMETSIRYVNRLDNIASYISERPFNPDATYSNYLDPSIGDSIIKFDFRGALGKLMELSSFGNLLLQFNEPWNKIKNQANEEEVKTIMNLSIQIVTALSVICRPFLPFTSDAMRKMLNLDPLQDKGELSEMLEKLEKGIPIIEIGHQIGQPVHLFTRISDEVIDAQIKKLEESDKMNNPQPEVLAIAADSQSEIENLKSEIILLPQYKPLNEVIQYDDFVKIDIRTATILTAEKVEKADKLLKLGIDLGFETRTIVSGIAEHFKPEEIIGQQILVIANLAPRKLRGIESNGMILMAENTEGKLSFVTSPEGWMNGAIVK